jgi:hypothetical protein
MLNPDFIGQWVALFLTLVVFSYLIKDNFLYRLAIHILVGVAAGYALLVAYKAVLEKMLILPLLQDPQANVGLVVPLTLGLLLLTKLLPRMGWMGNVSMAFLFGVGAALAIGGAVVGTIWPQTLASISSFSPTHVGLSGAFNNFILFVGAVSALFYFYFTGTRKSKVLRALASLGKAFIMIAFGALFATGLVTFVSLLISRINFILEVLGW